MSTLAQLRTAVARDLRDPGLVTFDAAMLTDYINAGIVEVSRLAPKQYTATIAVLADTMSYALPSVDTTLRLVEVWDTSYTPDRWRGRFTPGSGEWSRSSAAGWRVWNGVLELTNAQEALLDPLVHVLRVWGYTPYAQLSADGDVLETSIDLEVAIRAYVRVEALRSLDAERALFAQWQGASHNTDVSPAALLGMLNQAEDSWRRQSNRLFKMREAS